MTCKSLCSRKRCVKLVCTAAVALVLVSFLVMVIDYVQTSLAIINANQHGKWRIDPVKGSANFFFTETSCWQKQLRSHLLNARQACAVESAARTNPTHQIYLLHTCISDHNSRARVPDYVKQLGTYPNVHINFLDISALVQGTTMEDWWGSGQMRASKWPVSHTSDLVRFMLLYKYGGIYADLDVMVLKDLADLGNFVGTEYPETLGSSIMGFKSDGPGHKAVTEFLEEYKAQFRGDDWTRQGPALVQRVLLKRCNVSKVSQITPENCGNITIHPSVVFYPVYFSLVKRLFQLDDSNLSLLNEITGPGSRVKAVHLWNDMSFKMPVSVRSGQIYSILASVFCPRVHANCGEDF